MGDFENENASYTRTQDEASSLGTHAFYLTFILIDVNGRGKKFARKLNRQAETEIAATNLLK